MYKLCVAMFALLAICFAGCRDNRSLGPSVGESLRDRQTPGNSTYFATNGRDVSGADGRGKAADPASSLRELDQFDFPASPKSEEIGKIIEEAKQVFDSLVELFPKDVDAFDTRGRFYYFLGNHHAARLSWESGLKLNPQDPYCLNGLGLIHQVENDFESALAKFQQALMVKPKDFTLHLHSAKALVKLGRLEEAIVAIGRCLELRPQSTETWELLGQTYHANDQLAEAKQAFKQALQRSPDSYIAQQGMSAVLVRLNQREEAKRWNELQRANRARSTTAEVDTEKAERRELSQHLGEAANVLLKNGKTREAVATLSFSAVCSPDEWFPVQLLAEAFQRLGKINQAIEAVNKFLSKHPERIDARLMLFNLYFNGGNWVKALQVAEESVRGHPEEPEAYVSLLKSLMLTGERSERLVEASERLVGLRGSAFDQVLYAQALHLSGRLSEAIEALRMAVQLEPENSDYHAILSQLQAEERQK